MPSPGLSRRLWVAHLDIALASLSHPFVLALQKGRLQTDAARKYIAQDAYYLASFGSAFGSARSLCATKNDSKGASAFQSLQDSVTKELRMHEELSRSLHIDLAVRPLPSTALYVDFLNTCAKSQSVAVICAAMVPCMALYAFIGARATTNGLCPDVSSNRWVSEYSSVEFHSYSAHLESLLDEYAASEGASEAALAEKYRMAMELEYAFFNAFEVRSWSGFKPSAVFIDFDETVTTEDSVALICASKSPSASSEYAALLEAYLTQHSALLGRLFPASSAPGSVDRAQVIAALTDFDTAMLEPVERSGILQGCTRQQLRLAGAGIPMREGVLHTLAYASMQLDGAPLHVVSLHWSHELVLACMRRVGCPVEVHCNDLEMDASGESTGRVVRRLTGAGHKLVPMRQVLARGTLRSADHHPSVFVGDGLGDASALLLADVGVLVSARESTLTHFRSMGIALRPIEALVSEVADVGVAAFLQARRGGNPLVYTAESWAMVGFCLFGKPFTASWLAHTKSPIDDEEGLRPPSVLTVAGSDSGGGAGIQADIKACCANGVFAASAITALTAQNTCGVLGVQAVSADMLALQLEAVLGDMRMDAVKTGMVPTEAAAREVCSAVIRHAPRSLVVDPVMVASSGDRLMSADEAAGIRAALFPLATLVTPNLHEACALLGIDAIKSVAEMETAAKKLFEFGSAYVLVKGGHLVEGQASGEVVDVLYDGQCFEHVAAGLVSTRNTHGTGCTLASCIAAGLAKGLSVSAAVRAAKQYLTAVLDMSKMQRIGRGPHGPLNHMALLLPSGGSRKRRRNAIDLSVYAVTDAAMNDRRGRTMEQAVAAGGATVIQLREKSGSSSSFLALAKRVHALTHRAGVPLLINDRIDVALAAGAEGVHLGQSDIPTSAARRLLGQGMILGVSAKTVEQAEQAARDGADYLGVGAVYATATKTDATHIGLEGLLAVRRAVDLPIVAIGGIELGERARAVIRAGADGAAVVSALFDTPDVESATRNLASDVRRSKG